MKTYTEKFEEGEVRNAQWRLLTPGQQMVVLDTRLGMGKGARRQRAILGPKLMTLAATSPPDEPEVVVKPKKKKFKKGQVQ